MALEVVQIRLSKEQLFWLKKIKRIHKYANRSEVVRDAITDFIRRKTRIKVKSYVMR